MYAFFASYLIRFIVFLSVMMASACTNTLLDIIWVELKSNQMQFQNQHQNFHLLDFTWHNEGEHYSWQWNCLTVHFPIIFEPLKMRDFCHI